MEGIHVSEILWDKVWRGVKAQGPAYANCMEVNIRQECSRNCRSPFRLLEIEEVDQA